MRERSGYCEILLVRERKRETVGIIKPISQGNSCVLFSFLLFYDYTPILKVGKDKYQAKGMDKRETVSIIKEGSGAYLFFFLFFLFLFLFIFFIKPLCIYV